MIERLVRNPLAFGAVLVVAALLGAGAFALIQSMFPAARDRVAIERVVRTYLLEHPEILPEAMERLQAKETAKADAAAQKALASEGAAIARPFAGAFGGNPNGDVTVVAFLDYNCGYCRASLPAIAELVQRDPKVRIVYREYPVLGQESIIAARWALAAALQGKFKPFHDALYAAGRVNDASLATAASAAGLDMTRATQASASGAVENEIANNHRFGQQLGMTGTPAWVVGSRVLHGQQDYARLAEAVAEARSGN